MCPDKNLRRPKLVEDQRTDYSLHGMGLDWILRPLRAVPRAPIAQRKPTSWRQYWFSNFVSDQRQLFMEVDEN